MKKGLTAKSEGEGGNSSNGHWVACVCVCVRLRVYKKYHLCGINCVNCLRY